MRSSEVRGATAMPRIAVWRKIADINSRCVVWPVRKPTCAMMPAAFVVRTDLFRQRLIAARYHLHSYRARIKIQLA